MADTLDGQEGLAYDHQDEVKRSRELTPENNQYEQLGKIKEGVDALPGSEILHAAEKLRASGHGSFDPCYESNRKNKG